MTRAVPRSPDWRSMVRERLRPLDLPARQESKVVDELAQLLEEASDGIAFRSSREREAWVDEQVAEWGDLSELLRSRPGGRRDDHSFAAAPIHPTPGRGWRLGMLVEHIRYALRRMALRPGFSAIAILSLALGIGANTALFSFVDALVLRRIEVREPERLVNLYLRTPEAPYFGFSNPDYEDLVAGSEEIFSGVAGSRFVVGQSVRDGALQTLVGELVTGNFFDVLGLELALGRPLLPEDDVSPGAHAVVVLGHRYWRESFGGDPQVVGKTLRLANRPFEIVGVAPESYPSSTRGFAVDFFAPRMMVDVIEGSATDRLASRTSRGINVIARLRPGVSEIETGTVLDGIAAEVAERKLEGWHPQTSFVPVPTAELLLSPQVDSWLRATSGLLLAVVGLVLLMACTNLAGFLLAQAVDRRQEITLRLALGATRPSLVGQLLVESLLLAAVAGVCGVAIGAGLLRLLERVEIPLPMRPQLDLGLDPTVLGYTAAVTLCAGFALGLAPALHGTRVDLSGALRQEGAGGGRPGRLTLRGALIAAQVAVSIVLLVGAGLFLRSFQKRIAVDPGFGRDPAAMMIVMVPATRFDEDQGRHYVDGLLERFRAVPGVDDVGFASPMPLDPFRSNRLELNVDGVEPPPGSDAHTADFTVVDPEFFAATGVRLLEGRNFDGRDRKGSPPVAIVSRALAERFYPGRSALGERLDLESGEVLVVGVAADINVRSLGEEPLSFVYLPYSQTYTSFLRIVARTSRDAEAIGRELLAAGRDYDEEFWAWEPTTMERHIGLVALPARVSALLVSIFAIVAVGLATIGLYGIVSYAVRQRSRELGIRMVLGAGSGSVVRMLMATGLRSVLAGSVVGLVLAVLANRLIAGLLFRMGSFDPWAFAGAALMLTLTALTASWLPARRVSRLNPASALRDE